MNAILEANRAVVIAAGRELVEVGTLFSAGKIDEALARVEAARSAYPEWAELDRAIGGIEDAIDGRERAEAVREVLLDLLRSLLGAAVRRAIGL